MAINWDSELEKIQAEEAGNLYFGRKVSEKIRADIRSIQSRKVVNAEAERYENGRKLLDSLRQFIAARKR